MNAVNKHFPVRTMKISINRPFDLDNDLLHLMHQRDIAFRNARKLKTPETSALARAFRSPVSSRIRLAGCKFICQQIDLADGDSQKFWRINDSFFKTSEKKIAEIDDPKTGNLPQQIQSTLIFVPLATD